LALAIRLRATHFLKKILQRIFQNELLLFLQVMATRSLQAESERPQRSQASFTSTFHAGGIPFSLNTGMYELALTISTKSR